MFGGTFAGAAAQGLNQSLLEWQRLWLQEEQIERADQREQDRMDFEQQKLDWDKERAKMVEEGANDRLIQQREWDVLDNLWKKFNSSNSPAAQAAMAETFRGTGYYDTAVNSIQDGLFANPIEATAFLEEVLNADVGARYDPAVVQSAAEVAGRFGLGLKGDALTDFINGYVDWADSLDAEATEERARVKDALELDNKQAQANLGKTLAETAATETGAAHTEALTQKVFQQMGFDEDLHPINMQQASAAVDLTLAQIADIQQGTAFAAEMQPEVMRGLMYDNNGKLLDYEIQSEIRSYIVEQARNQAIQSGHDATIAGIIAEHATQNALLDIAIKEGNRDAIRQQLEIGVKKLEEMDLTNEKLGMQNEEYKQLTKEARIDTFTRLMASGDVELASEYADQYLRGIVSEDAYDRIIETTRERAELNLSAEEAQLRANTTIAFYEEQHAQEMAELRVREARARTSTAETDAAFRERQHAMDLAVSGANIAVARGNLALQQAQHHQRVSEGSATPSLETVMKAVKASTGYDMSDVGSAMDAYRIASADIAEERAAINAAIANPTPQNLENVNAITGIRPSNAEEARQLLAQREEGWDTRLESSSQEAQHVVSTIFNWAAPMGVPLSPQMFGLSEADYPIYYNAIQNNPSYRTVPDGVPKDQRDTAADIFSTIDSLSYGQDAAEITLGGAQAAFDELKATAPEGLLETLELESPADLHDYMVTSSREYDQNLQTATQLAELKGYNLSTSDDRQRAMADVNSSIQTADTLVAGLGGASQMSDSEREAVKQRALQWLASNGRQLSFAEEVMYGPGDLIQEINGIRGELSTGATALNWLIPRMAIQDAKGQLAPQ